MIYKYQKLMVKPNIIIFTILFSLHAMVACSSPQAFSDKTYQKILNKNNDPKTIFDVLNATDEVLKVNLKLNLAPLLEDRAFDGKEEGILSFKNADKQTVQYEVNVQLRGKYRRKVCQFPPFMLKFSKDRLEDEGLSDHNDIKLVTHCLDDKIIGNENVAQEYLLYKMYQELTSKSYRVQLIRITYEDKFGNYPKKKRYGFLIEDTDEMAERIGGLECEDCINLPADSLELKTENLMAIFQFMVGNADYNVAMNRNIKISDPGKGVKKIPVPYDFDFSGIIAASYAIPNNDFGLTSIKDRAYLGMQASKEYFEENLALFKDKEKNFKNIIRDSNLLSTETKDKMIAYLNSFYNFLDTINEDEDILKQMRAHGGDFSGPAAQFLNN